MALSSNILSEEQLRCSVCLDIFDKPVTIPCGHNFCMVCIERSWENRVLCQCPLCKEIFNKRPDLRVNRSFAEITEQFKRTRPSSSEEFSVKPGEVLCDFCTTERLNAVKSCLVCLASYCDEHIKPHYQGTAFRRHRLIDPVNNLENRICKKHERCLELFCKTDQMCICQLCTETDHRSHNTVSAETEWLEKKAQLGETEVKIQQMIQYRRKKMEEIKISMEHSKSRACREVENSFQVFSDLIRSIERSQAELLELSEEKQKAAERLAESLIKELEDEIIEIQRRHAELEQLSHTEDYIDFLQKLPSLCSLPHTKDWSEITVHTDLCLADLRRAVCQLEDRLSEEIEKLPEIKMRKMRQNAVDVVLDPNTAHPSLILSADGKQARHGDIRQVFHDNPERFDACVNVLGKDGFTSGKHYWEVQVDEKTEWTLGVASESIERKGKITLSPKKGYWTVGLRNSHEYKAFSRPSSVLLLSTKPRKIGVYVDYEKGQVSFYDAEARTHIYTFTDTFKEKMYPHFSPGAHEGGRNTAPLIISPINQADYQWNGMQES
ncbi:E3 ubiquitin-protein ligase TRIM39-like [Lepisosteus oculatus]|uniref:E3 ubiquitin-protein ligase TRIM39-like n=1 Tax=Lepisosteus oculatus TaxID=7918 RepID=UPI0035F512DC